MTELRVAASRSHGWIGGPSALLILGFAVYIALMAGPRYALLLLVGLGLGIAFEAFSFGFSGPWKRMVLQRDPAGLIAQLVAIGIVAVFAFPLLANFGHELKGAHAPVGAGMIAGAFLFGLSMQLVLGCGSGTLVNAGSGNVVAIVALPFFVIGSFLGSLHLPFWLELGHLPVWALGGTAGLMITLAGLGLVAAFVWWLAAADKRVIPRRFWLAAVAVAVLAVGHLVIAGQPFGVVYGLGLWGAKGASMLGADLSETVFWSSAGHRERLGQSLLTDVTSLTNIGLMAGAALVTFWRGGMTGKPQKALPVFAWGWVVLAGLLLGYSSRMAFGCNIGAFFSGISTGSLHGWVWFAVGFAGSWVGIKLRPALGLGS
ncbi:MAG: YeeE/YedE family protein [Pseudomonadota bacterium]